MIFKMEVYKHDAFKKVENVSRECFLKKLKSF